MPTVDYLIAQRHELAARPLSDPRGDTALLAWDDALPVLRTHLTKRSDGVAILDYDIPPGQVKAFIQSLPKVDREIKGVAPDSVLDRELVDRHSP